MATDVTFEIVDDGYAPSPGLATPIPGAIAALLANLATGVLRGNEARAVSTLLIAQGYVRQPSVLRALVNQHETVLNDFLREIDIEAIVRRAFDGSGRPGFAQCVSDPGAAVPIAGLGVLGGYLLKSILDAR